MPEKQDVRDAFRQVLQKQPDIGARNIVFHWFFQAPNLFDPTPRKRLKTGIVIVFSYIAFMALVGAAFHGMSSP